MNNSSSSCGSSSSSGRIQYVLMRVLRTERMRTAQEIEDYFNRTCTLDCIYDRVLYPVGKKRYSSVLTAAHWLIEGRMMLNNMQNLL
jgi:hypothetical protein